MIEKLTQSKWHYDGLIDKIDELVDAVNAMQPSIEDKLQEIAATVPPDQWAKVSSEKPCGGGPGPKPEEKLRDGDFEWIENNLYIYRIPGQRLYFCDFINTGFAPKPANVIGNILDHARLVQRGEVIVALERSKWEAIIHILADRWGHNNPTVAKLRKAMEAK